MLNKEPKPKCERRQLKNQIANLRRGMKALDEIGEGGLSGQVAKTVNAQTDRLCKMRRNDAYQFVIRNTTNENYTNDEFVERLKEILR